MQTHLVALVVSLAGLGTFGGLAAAPTPAQDSEPIGVTTKAGKTARVQVLELKDGRALLKVFVFGGEATLHRNLDDFVPESAYMIEVRATDPKTFEQHLALAKRAAELDLLPQAALQARAAIKLAGSGADADAKKKQVHAWAADALEKMIGEAVADGDLERADHCLGLLTTRVPEQRTEEQLAKIVASVDGLREQDAAKEAAERSAKADAKQAAELEKKLEPIRAKSAQGDKLLSKAMSQSNSTVAAAKSCDSAVDAYKAAFKSAQEMTKSGNDDALEQELAPLTDHIVESALRAALHAANVLTLQSDYKGAMDWVNRILKFDPDNADAKAMKQTIEAAEADAGDRDDYRYGGWGGARPRPHGRMGRAAGRR